MPLETLSEKIQMSLRRLTGRGKLYENDIDDAMRDIRVALLEADVNYKIVKDFIKEVKEESLGERVMKSLTPGDQVVKIVHEKLVKLMGDEATPINLKQNSTSVILMCGLQGSGKTTHAVKLASYLRKNNDLKPLLVACDVYRPAAINQLITLGKSINCDVYSEESNKDPLFITKNALKYANDNGYNLVIIDTAGRLQIDEVLMKELSDIKNIAKPDEIMLCIDEMTGQEAVNVTLAFNDLLKVTGCILTKLDSDTRGGAALSIRYLTNIPIKFIGVGEHIDELELFHPERMAKRILGMGDVVSLIEKATSNIDEDDAMKMMERLQKGIFTYNDFLDQIKMIRKMGSIKSLLGMIPGVSNQIKNVDIDDKQFTYIEVAISSMTKEERKHPDIIEHSTSRKMRIAEGSGRPYQEINALTKRFADMKRQMLQMSKMDPSKMTSPQSFMPRPAKPHKGKGKGKNGFRF